MFGNVFGCGGALVRSALVPRTGGELLAVLGQNTIWGFIVKQIVAGKQCEALAEPSFLLLADKGTFLDGNGKYCSHFEALQSYSQALPDWVNRVLLLAVGAEQSVGRLQYQVGQLEAENIQLARWSVRQALFKMNRERRRIKNQIKSLARRLVGTNNGRKAGIRNGRKF
ncbi:MAG: hypothetical protein AUI36_07015 [Cyanobacteria bacterium 13_1_40CM_2_61_4]|nr:MAG: hypothetical protein AUI36_07015 [Cyanobacteria bacterium 13_1_40CM_2_61_4]